MTTIAMASMGCPKNQVDAEIMLKKLADAGYALTGDEAAADLIIVNTCGFIESAKQESIDTILDLARYKKSGRLKGLLVTGCLAERYREELRRELPEIDLAVGIGCNGDIVSAVNDVLAGAAQDRFADRCGLPLEGARILLNEPYYAYLKIAEGCNNRCTYCAIPSIRGPLRSRSIESVAAEAEQLAKDGVKELVVVAQDVTRYGEDLTGKSELPALLDRLEKVEGLHWIRLLYAYPDRITDALLDRMAASKKVVPYLDVPIQHCCERVLRAMNRPGSRDSLTALIKKLRARIPGITLRTTLIAGFPGETEAEFDELCDFVRESKFDRLGCFAYSEEEGTPAAGMPGMLPKEERERRAAFIGELQSQIAADAADAKAGTRTEVLTEGYDRFIKMFYGRSPADAPDIDCKVFFSAPKNTAPAPGDLVQVRITDAEDLDLLGEMIVTEVAGQ